MCTSFCPFCYRIGVNMLPNVSNPIAEYYRLFLDEK